jgi:hypothetical protein
MEPRVGGILLRIVKVEDDCRLVLEGAIANASAIMQIFVRRVTIVT